MKERPVDITIPGIDPMLLQAFMTLFFPRQDLHAIQTRSGRYVSRKEPVTAQLVQDHLQGKVTLGTYALSEDSQAQWAAIDADDDKQWSALLRMVDDNDFPIYLEDSRRGGHAWLFFEERIAGSEARCFAKALLKPYKLDDIEIYPRQDSLAEGPGSLIRLPLGYHRKVKIEGQPGKRFGFMRRDGSLLAPSVREQLALVAYAERVPQVLVADKVKDVQKKTKAKRAKKSESHCPIAAIHEGVSIAVVGDERPLSERIKTSISVFDFVRGYVDLDGNNGQGLCPFHDDENPSFGVHEKNNYWSCYAGCGGGSVIDFWSLYRERVLGQDGGFIATIKDLAEILGL